MSHVGVLIGPEVKERLLRRAKASGRSVTVEVTVALLHRYRPESWRALESEILRRSRPRNGRRAEVIGDGEPEMLKLYLPQPLLIALQGEAGKNFRSLSAEIRMFLAQELEK